MMKKSPDWPVDPPHDRPHDRPHAAPCDPLRRRLTRAIGASASLAGVGALVAGADDMGRPTARPAAPRLDIDLPQRPATGTPSLHWHGGWILRQDDV